MNLSPAERIDKAQTILDKCFPKLRMTTFADHHNALNTSCDINYMSYILLAPGEITESVIRIRLLDMLEDMKRKIELNIEEIEK